MTSNDSTTTIPKHFDEKTINQLLTQVGTQDVDSKSNRVLRTDVFIAGTGPIGCVSQHTLVFKM